MLLLATSDLPGGAAWAYELKLDEYRAMAFKINGLSNYSVQDGASRHAEPFGNFSQSAQFNVNFTTFNLTHVRAVYMANISKVFLRPATGLP
jgi:hypothetical protein